MTFDIEVGGRTRSVAVEPSGAGRFRITIDGQDHLVDVRRVGDYGLSIIEDGASHEAQVVAGPAAGERLVWIDGRTIAASVDGRRGRAAWRSGQRATASIDPGADEAGGAHPVGHGDEVAAVSRWWWSRR